jgi:hypothetical protein
MKPTKLPEEKEIAFESEYFWVMANFEICLKMASYSICVGQKQDLESAKKFIDKAEKYPKNLKFMIPPEYRYAL